MLHLRLSVDREQADQMAEALIATGGVRRLARSAPEGDSAGVVLTGDVIPAGADEVAAILGARLDETDYVLTRQDVVTPNSARGGLVQGQGFAWIEVTGEARVYTRPPPAYLGLMGAAGAIAGIGVIVDNPIAIVGAMAIAPDLLPVCATCVGLVGRRRRVARAAFTTLVVGLLLTAAAAAALTLLLLALGIIHSAADIGKDDLGLLTNVDYTTIVIALAAGVAGMIAFSTRAGAAIGVAISVTTIPASAYLGAAFALGDVHDGAESLVVLTTNVLLLLIAGSLTLALLRRLGARRELEPLAPDPSSTPTS